ncbi:MAG: DNA-binding protein [Candidatus Hydrothermota bacterium]|nr:MAG: DNA-binding protein [Candidatus Hydrothermae bacterium]
MRKNEQTYKNWYLQACHDLNDAVFLIKGRRFNVACFLAQQAVEKAFKAFLLFKGADEVWGHSVFELCQDAVHFDKDFEKICSEVASLDKYYIPTRYPDALPGGIPSLVFGEKDATLAIEVAEKALNFIGNKLKLSCSGG